MTGLLTYVTLFWKSMFWHESPQLEIALRLLLHVTFPSRIRSIDFAFVLTFNHVWTSVVQAHVRNMSSRSSWLEKGITFGSDRRENSKKWALKSTNLFGAAAVMHSTEVVFAAAPGSNPGFAEIFHIWFFSFADISSLLLSSWTVERLKSSSAYARDFTNAVRSEGLS